MEANPQHHLITVHQLICTFEVSSLFFCLFFHVPFMVKPCKKVDNPKEGPILIIRLICKYRNRLRMHTEVLGCEEMWRFLILCEKRMLIRSEEQFLAEDGSDDGDVRFPLVSV